MSVISGVPGGGQGSGGAAALVFHLLIRFWGSRPQS